MMPDPNLSPLQLELALGSLPRTAVSLSAQDASQAPAQTSAPAGDATTSTAPPQEKSTPSPFGGPFMVPMLAIFAIFYFVMIAPERKARKKREAMLQELKKGDRVVTTGGMYAIVAAVAEDAVTLQIDDGVRARFNRAAIQSVLDNDAPAAKDAAAKKPG